jgi:hypothetical protein
MSGFKLGAIILLVAGILGLVYGGFRYTQSTDTAKIGPLEITTKDKRRVNVPVWLSIGAIVAGSVLLLSGQGRLRA